MAREDYIEVSVRIQEFYDKYPNGSLQGEWDYTNRDGEQWLVYKAYAYRTPDDPRPGIGFAWEPIPGRTQFTRGSELMNGETSAWGRALAALGIAVRHGIASANEVRAAQARQTERTKEPTPDDDQWYTHGTDAGPRDRNVSAKQLQLIKQLCDAAGFTTADQALMYVNTCLDAAHLPHVTRPHDLSKLHASAVIDQMKNSIDVSEVTSH